MSSKIATKQAQAPLTPLRMECHKTFHRTLLHPIYRESFFFGCADKLFAEIIRHTSYSTHRQVTTTVLNEITAEKRPEIVNYKFTNRIFFQVLVDKTGGLGKETVGKGFTVDFLDDSSRIKACLPLIFLIQSLRKKSFAKRTKEEPSHHGTAALVTEDIAKRRGILHQLISIVKP